MAIWSHNKLKHIKNSDAERRRINGDAHRFVPYGLDGWKRRCCKSCKNIYYTDVSLSKFRATTYHKNGAMKFCPNCDEKGGFMKREWKRMGTPKDDEVYKARCEAHGIKISHKKVD